MAEKDKEKVVYRLVDDRIFYTTSILIDTDSDPGMFLLGVVSGSAMSQHSLTPQHFKKLQKLVNQKMEEYEKKNGEIVIKE